MATSSWGWKGAHVWRMEFIIIIIIISGVYIPHFERRRGYLFIWVMMVFGNSGSGCSFTMCILLGFEFSKSLLIQLNTLHECSVAGISRFLCVSLFAVM
jgi:hypothetical protein